MVAFKVLIYECQRLNNLPAEELVVSPHHTKKFACSLSAAYWPDARGLNLNKVTGNKSYQTLLSYYIKDVPELSYAVSLPLGTAPQ